MEAAKWWWENTPRHRLTELPWWSDKEVLAGQFVTAPIARIEDYGLWFDVDGMHVLVKLVDIPSESPLLLGEAFAVGEEATVGLLWRHEHNAVGFLVNNEQQERWRLAGLPHSGMHVEGVVTVSDGKISIRFDGSCEAAVVPDRSRTFDLYTKYRLLFASNFTNRFYAVGVSDDDVAAVDVDIGAYFVDGEPSRRFTKAYISHWPGWLREENLHKLDEVTNADRQKFWQLLRSVSEHFSVLRVDPSFGVSKLHSVDELLRPPGAKPTHAELVKLVLPELDAMLTEEWDETYILWHTGNGAVESVAPLVREAGLFQLRDEQ